MPLRGWQSRTCPIQSLLLVLLAAADVLLRYHSILWIIWLRTLQQQLQTEEGSLDAKRWRPLILEDVQADCAGLAGYIRMPHLQMSCFLQRCVEHSWNHADYTQDPLTFVMNFILGGVYGYCAFSSISMRKVPPS